MTTAHDAAISVVARLTLCTPSMVAMGHYEPIIGLFQTDAAVRHVDDYTKVVYFGIYSLRPLGCLEKRLIFLVENKKQVK